jgi:LacI family transcriptional regulator
VPTIRDVAKEAGVSSMTVSRVINNSGYVSDKTKARIEAVIEELGYVPNMLGQSLRLKQTHTLALVITDITNPFWTTVARGVEDAAQENGYSVILCNTDESAEKQDQYITMLLKRRIDGILLVPTRNSAEDVQRIQKQGIKVVVLDRQLPDAQVDVVRGDSISGAYQLTQHLLAKGHRQIAMLAGPQNVSTSTERVDGYRQALREVGLENEAIVHWGRFSRASGYAMAQKVLTTTPRPTALFAANNFIAVGAYQAVRGATLHIPDDISLVSFGDLPPTLVLEPFLTVADHSSYDMGYQAGKLLIARLVNGDSAELQEIILPAELKIRSSTRAIE